jgi:hypothetical protein
MQLNETAPAATGTLADIQPIHDWLDQHAGGVFRTPDQWALFARQHKVELVESGALILGAGRKPDMASGGLSDRVRQILLRESIARLNAGRSATEQTTTTSKL